MSKKLDKKQAKNKKGGFSKLEYFQSLKRNPRIAPIGRRPGPGLIIGLHPLPVPVPTPIPIVGSPKGGSIDNGGGQGGGGNGLLPGITRRGAA